jgi:hypothetical protein
MADGDVQTSPFAGQNERFRGERGSREGGSRGPRDGGNRDAGGFRIRLSDNEMRAARAVQEAFGLRSTVAALGLSIRTVAQLLEEGKLDEVLAQQRAAGGGRPPRERREGGRDGSRDSRDGRDGGRGERGGSRPNPFARPAKPAAPVAVIDAATDSEPEAPAAESEPSATPGDEAAVVITEVASEVTSEATPDATEA